MKVLFLSNNEISDALINWLKNIAKEDVTTYDKSINIQFLKRINPDFVISYNYRYRIEREIIAFMKNNVINLHISLLPWNRGAFPNVWSFLQNTPKGVTIHIIDKGIDTGPILAQEKASMDENTETLRTSYEKLHKEIQMLFKNCWNDIKNGKINPKRQGLKGTVHYKRNFKKIQPLINDKGWDISITELKRRYKNSIGK